MDRSFWDRIHDMRESIHGGVEPLDTVQLPTRTIKLFLGLYLIQGIVIALVYSIKDESFSPWIIPSTALLHIGWFWNKVTDYWKSVRNGGYQRLYPDEENQLAEDGYEPPFNPPPINIQTEPLVGGTRHMEMSLNLQRARESQKPSSPRQHVETHPLDPQVPLAQLVPSTASSSDLWHTADSTHNTH